MIVGSFVNQVFDKCSAFSYHTTGLLRFARKGRLMTQMQQLLKELTEAPGVPGYESPIRAVVRKYFEPLGDLSQDKIGSLICKKVGPPALQK